MRKGQKFVCRYLAAAILLIILPMSLIFSLWAKSSTTQMETFVRNSEEQQLRLLEQMLKAEFYNCSEIVKSLPIYQDVRPFYLQNFPSNAVDLIHDLQKHFTNNNIVDDIFVHFFCDEYFYSTQTSYSRLSFMSRFNLDYGSGEEGKKFMEQMSAISSPFYLRDITLRQSASQPNSSKVI